MSANLPYTIRWWFVRHAPVINPDDLTYGSMDLDSTFEGMEPYTKFLRSMLPTGDQCHIRTSALKRSQQTLKNIWPKEQISPDPAWNEQSLGAWEGQPRTKIYAPTGPIRALFENLDHFRPPATNDSFIGESWADVSKRVVQSMEAEEKKPSSRHEIVFCHAGAIRAAIGHALKLDAKQVFGFQIAHMSLTRLDSVHFFDEGKAQQSWCIGGINLVPEYHAL